MYVTRRQYPDSIFAVCAAIFAIFVMKLSGSFGEKPWRDEIISIAVAQTENYMNIIHAVYTGIDATPPTFITIEWFVLAIFGRELSPLTLIRAINVALLTLTFVNLNKICQFFVDRRTSILGLAIFASINSGRLISLAIEARTYTLYMLAASLGMLCALRFVEKPSRRILIHLSLSLLLLVATHTFGVIYAVIIGGSLTAVTRARLGHSRAVQVAAACAPAGLLFLIWAPIMAHQSQLGSWIVAPDVPVLLSAYWLSPSSIGVFITAGCILVLQNEKGHLRRAVRLAKFSFVTLVVVGVTGATMLIGLFSKFVFPIYVQRYFFPNLLIILVPCLIFAAWVLKMRRHKIQWRIVLAATAVLLCCISWTNKVRSTKIQCRALTDNLLPLGRTIITPNLDVWLTMLNDKWIKVLGVVDEDTFHGSSIYRFEQKYLRAFSDTLGIGSIVHRSELILSSENFSILDESSSSWAKDLQSNSKFAVVLRNEEDGCKLWDVTRANQTEAAFDKFGNSFLPDRRP